jgi:hypothetical protein
MCASLALSGECGDRGILRLDLQESPLENGIRAVVAGNSPSGGT